MHLVIFWFQSLVKERDDVEDDVYRVVSLGRDMLEDERFSDDNEQEYIDRMDDLERRMKMLMDWPDGADQRYKHNHWLRGI